MIMDVDHFLQKLAVNSPNRVVVETALSAVANFKDNTAKGIRANRRLSPQGHAEEVQAAARKGPLEFLALTRKQLRDERGNLEKRRANLQIKAPDPANLASAIERMEVRTYVRSMSPGERVTTLLNPDCDDRILEAVLNAPAPLAGVTTFHQNLVRDIMLERKFGPELKIIADEADELEVTSVAVNLAEQELRREAGLQPLEVEKAEAEIQATKKARFTAFANQARQYASELSGRAKAALLEAAASRLPEGQERAALLDKASQLEAGSN
jgi:hypothetical protein